MCLSHIYPNSTFLNIKPGIPGEYLGTSAPRATYSPACRGYICYSALIMLIGAEMNQVIEGHIPEGKKTIDADQ